MGDPGERGAYRFGPFQLDIRERRLSRGTDMIPLRLKVFDTLCVLVENAGRLVTKEELLDTVWPDTAVEENNLNHNVSVLRKALGEKATGQQYIETVPRVGYRFVAPVETASGNRRDLWRQWRRAEQSRCSPHRGLGRSVDADQAVATSSPRPRAGAANRPSPPRLRHPAIAIAASIALYLVRSRTSGRAAALAEKDSVLIADLSTRPAIKSSTGRSGRPWRFNLDRARI